jgi:hypothetical protein
MYQTMMGAHWGVERRASTSKSSRCKDDRTLENAGPKPLQTNRKTQGRSFGDQPILAR